MTRGVVPCWSCPDARVSGSGSAISIVVTVVKLAGDRVRLGIEAPSDVLVLRDELQRRDIAANPLPAVHQ